MALEIRPYQPEDVASMLKVWNESVEDGESLPHRERLDEITGAAFFASRALCVVAAIDTRLFGLYILQPRTEGRGAHVGNLTVVIASSARGVGLGKELVKDALDQARRRGYIGLFADNVIVNNEASVRLFEGAGFLKMGQIPGGFINFMGGYEDIALYYKPFEPVPCARCGEAQQVL